MPPEDLLSRRAAMTAESQTTPGKLVKKLRLEKSTPEQGGKDSMPGNGSHEFEVRRSLFEEGVEPKENWRKLAYR